MNGCEFGARRFTALRWTMLLLAVAGAAPSAAAQTTINSRAQFLSLVTDLNSGTGLDGWYVLAVDIDLAAASPTPPVITIGSAAAPFRGTFDGNGHTIRGVRVAAAGGNDDNLGLFGVVTSVNGGSPTPGTVKNLTIELWSATGDERVGGLVGPLTGGMVENCHVVPDTRSASPVVTGLLATGGLVGWSEGVANGVFDHAEIIGCTSAVDVVGLPAPAGVIDKARWTGGLVGHAHIGSEIENSDASGDVVGVAAVGGLFGNLHASTASNCTATGDVDGAVWVGGATGFMEEHNDEHPHASEMIGCNAFGDAYMEFTQIDLHQWGDKAQAAASAGGLIGFVEGRLMAGGSFVSPTALVDDCLAAGDVVFQGAVGSPSIVLARVGGLIGWVDPNALVTWCEAAGDVRDNMRALGGSASLRGVGGLFGYMLGDASDCVWTGGSVYGVNQVGGIAGALDGGTSNGLSSNGRPPSDRAILECCRVIGAPEVYSQAGTEFVFRLQAANAGGALGGFAGGLVGYVFPKSTIENCTSDAIVSSPGAYIGGITGVAWDMIVARTEFTGQIVSSTPATGGLVGAVEHSNSVDGDGTVQLEDCRFTGDIVLSGSVSNQVGFRGGVVGYAEVHDSVTIGNKRFAQSLILRRCFSAGIVEDAPPSSGMLDRSGGAIGHANGFWNGTNEGSMPMDRLTVTQTYFDSTLLSQTVRTNEFGAIGYSTSQMHSDCSIWTAAVPADGYLLGCSPPTNGPAWAWVSGAYPTLIGVPCE